MEIIKDIEKYFGEIWKNKIFRSVEREDLQKIEWQRFSQLRSYKKGEILLREGEKMDFLGVIIKGEIDVTRMSSDGNQTYLNLLRKGDLMGIDMMCQTGYFSLYYYQAKSDVEVFRIPSSYIMFFDEPIPERVRLQILRNIIQILAHENSRQHQKLDILSSSNLRDRIWSYLSYQRSKHRSDTFRIPFNREQLASFLCVNRSALSRELSRMEKEGLLKYDKNTFSLLKYKESEK